MKKCNTVKNNRDFNYIIGKNNYVKDANLMIYYSNKEKGFYRFGISVGKKLGNAVVRNYNKRRIRNIIDKNKNLYSNETDYIIIVRRNCLSQSFEQINESFVQLMNRINQKEGAKNEKK